MKKLTLILGCALATAGVNAQSATFNYTGSLQTWTVPCTSSITITSYGAQGGTCIYGTGALGAEIIGTFTVIPGAVLDILVGQAGTGGPVGSDYFYCGSGGGGSYVWNSASSSLPMIVAGGGGGGSDNGNGSAGVGSATQTPTPAIGGQGSVAGGSGGNGGAAGGSSGSGAGWLSDGGNGYSYPPYGANGGADPADGGAGGSYLSPGWTGGYGGGGGCSGNNGSGGGGGGYNGGGSGIGGGNWGSGGGGGSYNGGSNQTNNAGVQSGNGIVTITWIVGSSLVTTGNVINNVSCNGGSNGKASGIVSGGSAPFTYAWAPSGGTHDTASGLSAGTYTITVTAACGGSSSASVTITQPAAIVVTATTSSNVTCNAGSNGATASTVTGGTTPYTYSWTGGSTNTTATGLSAGTYTLNVRDMNGCTASASTVVTQPNVLSDTSFATANVLCHGDSSGSAFTTASGGTMPYTYLWTPGGGTTDTAVGLKAGSYTVTVSDACGASATASVSVTQPSALSITSHSTPDNGHGVGTAAVSVSGGMSPYTYLWSPGGNSTDSISGKAKGTYCCKVTDANGCIDSLCVVIKSTAGIDGITGNSSQIIVYPNPNNGQFTIASSISGASTVEIYNILGEKVFTKNLSTTKGTNQINVSNQPNGVYLYRVISESGDLLGQGKITLQK